MMKVDEKMMLLARLNAAWTLSDWRSVDVEEAESTHWNVTYQHRETGEKKESGLYKSELDRAEANMRVRIGRLHVAVSAGREHDGKRRKREGAM